MEPRTGRAGRRRVLRRLAARGAGRVARNRRCLRTRGAVGELAFDRGWTGRVRTDLASGRRGEAEGRTVGGPVVLAGLATGACAAPRRTAGSPAARPGQAASGCHR